MSMKKFFAMKNANKNKKALRPEARRAKPAMSFQAETLETRIMPVVGIKPVRTASFIDADGDAVKVSLKGGDKSICFTITLDGGASNKADIQSIVIVNSKPSAVLKKTVDEGVLSVVVKTKKVNQLLTGTGQFIKVQTPGFTYVTDVESGFSLRGINGNAVFGKINVTGSGVGNTITSGNVGSVSATGAGVGGIAIDISKAQFFTNGVPDFNSALDFGTVTVAGNLGSLILRGRIGGGNDLLGTVTVGGSLGILDARFSDVIAPVNVGGNLTNLVVKDVFGSVAVGGTIGEFRAVNLFSDVNAGGVISTLALSSSMVGTLRGAGLTQFSVDGNFSGLVQTSGNIANTVINGTSFTGTLQSTEGNIGNVLVARSTTNFGGHLVTNGSIGNLTAGTFVSADIEAGTSIGLITANADFSQVTNAINGSTFNAHNGNILGVTSAATITGSQFHATGSIGNITSTQGGLTNLVVDPTSIGNITANLTISGNAFLASGAIGNITSLSGNIGSTNTIVGGSVGNVQALYGIYDTEITATTGNIGNINAQTGRISRTTVTAQGSIGNISANSTQGNNAISYSVFTAATGSIGNISAFASARGGNGIVTSAFQAERSIGSITATATHPTSGLYGIGNSTFTVTGASNVSGDATLEIGNVVASGNAGRGINSTFFHAVSGDIGNVKGTSVRSIGIYNSQIESDLGNVGVVTGYSYGGSSFTGGAGLRNVTISAGAGGVGRIGGIVGKSEFSHGLQNIQAFAGTGGIGNVTGTNVSPNSGSSNGINGGRFITTGSIGAITGKSASSHGINGANFTANQSIGAITGYATTYGDGIYNSTFTADNGIGVITGKNLGKNLGRNGIYLSTFRADFDYDGTGTIAGVTGTTAGNGSGIKNSTFNAGFGIGNVLGAVTEGGGYSGILSSNFNADRDQDGFGAIGNVTGNTRGTGNGIQTSNFLAGSGIDNVTGHSYNPGGRNGIFNSTFNGDNDHNGVGEIGSGVGGIGSVTGISETVYGAYFGITGSTFLAGDDIGNVLGSTTARSSGAAGINNSTFLANAGVIATPGGIGSIGAVTGIDAGAGNSAIYASGTHYGIKNSTFSAGNGNGGNGTIGAVSGIVNIFNGAAAVTGIGIEGTTITAGTGTNGVGNIGNVSGTATADGIGGTVTARGINSSSILAGTGSGGTGNVGAVTGTASATSSLSAYAYGISSDTITGGYLSGSVGAVSGNATAIGGAGTTSGGTAGAYGVISTTINSGIALEGSGTIYSINGTAVAQADDYANAYGLYNVTGRAGGSNGTISGVSGSAMATTTGATSATGGYDAHATGIRNSSFAAGFYSSTGFIGNVNGYGKATSTGLAADARGIGIDNSSFYAGARVGASVAGDFGTGTIQSISGTGIATATGLDGGDGQALAYGLRSVTAQAADGDYGVGTIGSVGGTATATATGGDDAYANAYGIGGTSSFGAGTGFGGTGTINSVSGTATANATAPGDVSDYARAGAIGIDPTTITAGGYGTGYGTGVIGNVSGTGNATATGGGAYARGRGQLDTTINSGGHSGTIGDVSGTGSATATSFYADARAVANGIQNGTMKAGGGYQGDGTVGDVTGIATANAYASGLDGDATATANGIDPTYIGAGNHTRATGAHAGSGQVGQVLGVGTANATATGFDGDTSAKAYGINGLTIAFGNAYASAGAAFAGSGGTIGGLTGTANATSTASGELGDAYARAEGVKSLTVNLNNAYGYGYALGGVANFNLAINSTSNANATASNNVTVIQYGLDGLTLNLGNATASGSGTAVAFGGTGTVGNINVTQNASAVTTGGPYGVAKATSTAIYDLTINAGNANATAGSTGLAYGGTGIVGSITGTATATATGFAAYATAYGIHGLDVYVGNAYGSGYGNNANGLGIVGDITGNATATATSNKPFALGYASAYAAGILGSKTVVINAGNAYGGQYGAFAGVGTIGDVSGNASAKAIANGPLGGETHSSAYGVKNFEANAGNATATGSTSGNAKPGRGVIGCIDGDAYAYTLATGGYDPIATSHAEGLLNVSAYAANAYATTGNAFGGYGYLDGFTGTGIAIAIAKGGVAYADAEGYGMTNIRGYAANATTISGIATAGSGYIGLDCGIVGIGNATATATGTITHGSAYSDADGIHYLYLHAADAGSSSGDAFGGFGTITDVTGTATADASATGATEGSASADADAIQNADVYAANATTGSYGDATGGVGTIGDITGVAIANADGTGTLAYADASAIGINNVDVDAANASTSSSEGDTATGGTGVIGNFGGTGTADAIAIDTNYSTAYAYGKGINNAYVYAANASGDYAYAGPGTIGTLDGTGTATATGDSAVTLALGIDPSKFGAANAYGSNVAVGGTGIIAAGGVNGVATAISNATGLSTRDQKARAYGISGLTLNASNASASDDTGDATGGNGLAGNITGVGTAHEYNGSTTSAGSDVYSRAFGIDVLTVNVSNATGGLTVGGLGKAGNGTVGIISGTATGNTTGTTTGADSDVYSEVLGLDALTFNVSNATGYNATGGTGLLATASGIAGTAVSNVTGTTAGANANVVSHRTMGILNLSTNVSNATGSLLALGTALGGNGTVGNVTGTASTNVSGTTTGADGDIYAHLTYGIEDNIAVSNATGYVATGGNGQVGALTGNATAIVNGTTAGATASIYANYTAGLDNLDETISTATGGAGALGSATGGTGTLGTVTGSATATVSGTTSGVNANVYANYTYGLSHLDISVSNATGYYAKGGNGQVAAAGGIIGTAVANVTGTSSAANADIYSIDTKGIHTLNVNVSNATGSTSIFGSGTAGDGTVGTVTGTALANVSGSTYGVDADIYAANTFGIDDDINVSNATGYLATAGNGVVGNLTGNADATVNGTTSATDADVYARTVIGLDNLDVTVSTATTTSTSFGSAFGGNGTLGTVSGAATATVSGTTSGSLSNDSSVYADDTYGVNNVDIAISNATGSFADAGDGRVGNITGSAVADVTGTTAGTNSDVYAAETEGIRSLGVNVSNATSQTSTDGSAYGGNGTVGNVTGTANATVQGTTNRPDADVYALNTIGIDDDINVSNASGYRADAGDGQVGNLTGNADATVNGTTSATNADVYARTTIGLDNLDVTISTGSSGSTSYGRATGGNGTLGTVSGAATATVSGTTSGSLSNDSSVYADDTYGVNNVDIAISNATGSFADAGDGRVGNISGSAVADVTGTTAGTNSDVYANGTIGIYNLNVSVSNATSQTTTAGSAYGGNGTVGNVTGTASASVLGTTQQDDADIFVRNTVGIDDDINVSNAAGYVANGGNGIVGNLTGNANAAVNGITSATDADVYARTTVGIENLDETISTANTGSTGYGRAAGGNGTLGNVAGTATATVSGTTNGSHSNDASVFADDTYGLHNVDIAISNAVGSFADAGDGRVGTITGNAVSDVTGTTAGTGSDVYAIETEGILSLGVDVSNATSQTATTGSAYGGNGTVGNVTGTANATVVGTTDRPDSAVYTRNTYGINDDITVSTATGYTAVGGNGQVGALTGSATANVTGTTSATNSDIYARNTGGLENLDPRISTANTTSTSFGVATGGNGTLGNVTGNATAIVSGSTSGSTSSNSHIYANYTTGLNNVDIAVSSAYGYTATGGDGRVAAGGAISGSAVASVTGSTTGDSNCDVYAAYTNGIHHLSADVSDATSSTGFAKAIGTAGNGTVGDINGYATATVSGTTLGSRSAVDTNDTYGINDTNNSDGIFVSNAIGRTAIGGNGTVGSSYGVGVATIVAGSSTAGTNSDIYADETGGINELAIRASIANSTTGYANAVATGGNGQAGDVTGTATATVTGTVSGIDSKNSDVDADITRGVAQTSVGLSNATGYSATAGDGTMGDVSGSATATVTGSTAGTYSDVGAYTTVGVWGNDGFFHISNAYGYTGGKGIATGGNGTIGNITGTATATVSGSTTGTASDIYVQPTIGIGTDGSAYGGGTEGAIYVSNATGFTANAGDGQVGDITGTAISNGTGSVTAGTSEMYAGTKGSAETHIIGIKNEIIGVSNAYGTKVANGGNGTIGNVVGSATATVSGAIGGSHADAIALGIYNTDISVSTASATTATGGGGTVGNIYGFAVADAEDTSAAGDTSYAYAYAAGIKETDVYISLAVGTTATGGVGTVGSIFGTGDATAVGDNADAYAYGIDPSRFFVGDAYGKGYATGGTGTINDVDGYATADATATTGSAQAEARGISGTVASNSVFSAGNAYSPAGTAIGGVGSIAQGRTIYGKAHADANGGTSGSAYAYGIQDTYITAGNGFTNTGTSFGGDGTIGDTTGSAVATASGAKDYAEALGIDPSFFAAGNSLSEGSGGPIGQPASPQAPIIGGNNGGTGVIGNITGLATADDTDNDERAIGIDSLTVYAGAGTGPVGGDGTIGDITGESFTAQGTSIGIENSQFTAGSTAAGGSGFIGNILGEANSAASTAFAIRDTNFEAVNRIAGLTTQESGSGGTGAGGSFFRSRALAAAVGFVAGDVSIGSSVDGFNTVLNVSAGNYGITNIAGGSFLLGGVSVTAGSSIDQYSNGASLYDEYTS